ncbi:unnamed protein product [Camellia sinensis]
MEDNTGSRESKKKSMEDNTRSSESKEKRRKSMEDNTRPTENESEEDILDEGDEEADEEHDQEPEVLVQPEPVVNKAPEVSSAPEEETRVYARILCAEVHSSRSASSFFRKAGQGTPRKMNKLHVGATISSQSVPGQNIVLVRPRTLGQTNPKEHNGPVPMEGDEEIFEEAAVCKICFHNLKEENILKTECKCGNTLIHEDCAAKWSRTRGNNCDSCGQEVQTFPVTLVRGLSSSTQVVGREESNKSSLFSRLMRIKKA